jgi:hypothetical protein
MRLSDQGCAEGSRLGGESRNGGAGQAFLLWFTKYLRTEQDDVGRRAEGTSNMNWDRLLVILLRQGLKTSLRAAFDSWDKQYRPARDMADFGLLLLGP